MRLDSRKLCPIARVALASDDVEEANKPTYIYLPSEKKTRSRPVSRSLVQREWTRRPHSSMDGLRAMTPHEDLPSLSLKAIHSDVKEFNSTEFTFKEHVTERVEPFLGPKLKKALMKHGLEKQKISITPDDWDNYEVKLILGSMFSSATVNRTVVRKCCLICI